MHRFTFLSWQKYEFKEELGRGAFSIVKLAINKQSGASVAVKVDNVWFLSCFFI
jgi:serine/threonine protein kinase